MKSHVLGIGFSMGLLMAAGALAPREQTAGAGLGSATARVIHPITSEPVPGMPVTVRLIVPGDEGDGTIQVFVTGRDGSALLSPLEDGTYEVYVDYNNHTSDSAFFTIDGFTDYHPVVTLLFNPDIDPSS